MKLDLSGLDQFKPSDLLGPAAGAAAPRELDLALIDFDAAQPRRRIDDQALAELAASIKIHGVLEPVSLRSHPDCPGRYLVNRGERRVRASRLAGRRTVPWLLDERADPYLQVIENLQRQDLSPFDIARFIAEREHAGDSRSEIARQLCKPASFVTEAAALVVAPPELAAAVDAGRIKDTRVLYRVARALRDNPESVAPVLTGDGPITRETLKPATPGMGKRRAAAPDAADRRVIEATKPATALLVDHRGQRGRLALAGHAGKRTGEVRYENGSRAMVELAELQPIAWTVR
jgi:ParB family chromosome partitioning protein